MALISVPSLATVLTPLAILVTTMFGAGLQQTSPMPYLSIALTLGYLDRLGPWSEASILPTIYLVIAAGTGAGFAYAGMLQLGDKWSNVAMVPMLLVGIGITILQIIALSIHVAWQRRFLPRNRFQNGAHALLATLVGPTIWVATFMALYAVSPLGTYGSIAYSQYQFEPLVQWASFSGISGIEFFVVWAAVIIHRCWSHHANESSQFYPSQGRTSRSSQHPSSPSSSYSSTLRLARRILFAPTPTFLLVTLFISIYGSMRFWNASGTFYQKPLADTMLPTVRASCVVGSADLSDMPLYLNQTHELARTGSKIIIWSETVTTVRSTRERDALWATARNITQTYGILLGIAYAQRLDEEGLLGWTKNMYTLFDERGKVLFEYQKAHPVFMVENTVQPGPRVVPVVNTTYGRVAGAICFDLDVDTFIEQAGHKEADLFLQPSWTWGM
ncbi:hypothetical protein BGZ92_008556 [Podila epicladia]|nr:hypothetical protein BGZ92_008556 [Podila epicladia]